jgi:hypothetical protein
LFFGFIQVEVARFSVRAASTGFTFVLAVTAKQLPFTPSFGPLDALVCTWIDVLSWNCCVGEGGSSAGSIGGKFVLLLLRGGKERKEARITSQCFNA